MAKKILVIEDNKSMAALLCAQLLKAGFEVIAAPDAMLGTKECVRWHPDLVLLDLMLPAGGGLGVLKNLRNSVYTSNTTVFVLSGSTEPELRKKVAELGVTTFLKKPHDPKELLALIHNVLGTDPAAPAAAA